MALENLTSVFGLSRLADRTPKPSRESIHFPTRGEERIADIYLSPEGARAGIVLVPGVAARGRRDARLVTVAKTLARLRFAVMVPDMPGIRHYRMRTSDVREIADAFAWLIARPDLAPEGHAGIGGFSYAAGPVLLAALEPDIREQVNFVLSVGGYYSMQNVITFITTGRYTRDTEENYLAPHPYTESTFIRSYLDLLDRPVDRGFMSSYANFLAGDTSHEEEPHPGNLAADAQAFYELLTNHDPARVAGLIAQQSPPIRAELHGLDPSARDLTQLHARVILLHGRGDNLIPYTESIALADRLPDDQAELFLLDGLAHVNLKPRAHDIPQLMHAMNALLRQRLPENPVQERL